jgi:hypothetical protein
MLGTVPSRNSFPLPVRYVKSLNTVSTTIHYMLTQLPIHLAVQYDKSCDLRNRLYPMFISLLGVRTLRYLYNYSRRKTRTNHSRLHFYVHSDFATDEIYFYTRQVFPH